MKSSAKKIELASVDDLFSTEEGRQDAKLEKIQEIPLSELHPFKNHPFKVKDDEAMMETADSIKQYGVLVPAIARPDPEGGYELVAGHRRHRASELAEKETMPVIVRDLDDDAATIIMVDSNLQRESLLPSERALLDDLKENPVVDLAYGRKFAYEVPSVTNGIQKKMDLISYEQYQFDWAKDYLLEGSLESVQTDLGTGLIVYNSQNTIQIGDTVSLNTNGQSKEIQIVGMLSDCPFYSAAGVGTIICSEDTFEQITGESKYTVIDVQLVKGTTDEDVYVIRQMVDSSFTFADERMGNSSTMGTYYCFWLFIYGFLVLIAMITIFNIINSISMSVSARLKQYGAFRAIGVSMGQLSKMIVAEAFTYTIIGGVVGTVLGLFCNKLLFGMLISYRWGDAWTPPLPEVAVILLIVVSSVILAVHGPIKRIRNMSIVDTISAQ